MTKIGHAVGRAEDTQEVLADDEPREGLGDLLVELVEDDRLERHRVLPTPSWSRAERVLEQRLAGLVVERADSQFRPCRKLDPLGEVQGRRLLG